MVDIITINTWKCDGDYFNRLLVLVKNIEKTKPHILLLQEAFQSSDNICDTTRYIAERLHYYNTSSQSRLKKRLLNKENIDSFSNVSIITKYPILNRHIISLPSNYEDCGREAIAVEIVVNKKRILIINVHLSHLNNGDDLRMQQLHHILDQSFLNSSFDAIFMGGDFNFAINKEHFAELQKDKFIIEDTFIYRNKKNGPDYTLSYQNTLKKVDHILQITFNDKKKLKVKDSKIVFYEPDRYYGIKTSDHNGVMVRVKL